MNKYSNVCPECGAPKEHMIQGTTAPLGRKFLHVTYKCKICGAWYGGLTLKKKKTKN